MLFSLLLNPLIFARTPSACILELDAGPISSNDAIDLLSITGK